MKSLARALLDISETYPLSLRTERDFFPLVLAYLHGRFPRTTAEVGTSHQKIDFRVGGNNPVVLELAVAPRALIDKHRPGLHIPGHGAASQLYAANNKTELAKLAKVSKAKARYLLLLDLQGRLEFQTLKAGYEAALPLDGGAAPVSVVYARTDDGTAKSFRVGGRKKGRASRRQRHTL